MDGRTNKNCQTIAVTLRLCFVARVKYVAHSNPSIQAAYSLKMVATSTVPSQKRAHGQVVAAATIDVSLIRARLPIQSKGSRDSSLCVVECSSRSGASCVHWFILLKRGIKLARLSFTAV